jgi:hypothetical protein
LAARPSVSRPRQLLWGLHPLGYHLQAQSVSQVDHRRHYLANGVGSRGTGRAPSGLESRNSLPALLRRPHRCYTRRAPRTPSGRRSPQSARRGSAVLRAGCFGTHTSSNAPPARRRRGTSQNVSSDWGWILLLASSPHIARVSCSSGCIWLGWYVGHSDITQFRGSYTPPSR